VPAAIMSIAAANLYARSVHMDLFRPACSSAEQTRVARAASLVVKTGALLFVLFLPTQFAIYFQLLAGAWILQTFPAIVIGLYTRWLHRRALFTGWLVGMILATWMAFADGFSPVFALHLGSLIVPMYIGLIALVINLGISVLLTAILSAARVPGGVDATSPMDYVEAPVAIS